MNTIGIITFIFGMVYGDQTDLRMSIGTQFEEAVDYYTDNAKAYDMADPIGKIELYTVIRKFENSHVFMSASHVTSIPDTHDRGIDAAFIGWSVRLK